ncbi:MAG: YqeG family HAD IIIA-type phosphatase [Caldicoprobacterales bacterium]|nr:YqeG family HAD IIIA-type phosphatase [Clostridiales bacterium]
MRSLLKPRQTHASIFDIDLRSYWDRGYQNIIIDVDNTITAWNHYKITPKLKEWISKAKDTGFHICLLSNSSQSKIRAFALELGVTYSPIGGKPFARGFYCALTELGATVQDTLVIGDQIFTDILGGNRAGMFTILVDPIDKREFIGTRLTRLMERLVAGRRPVCKSLQQPR